jgi:Protein of unknown function (DUF3618)
VAAWLSALIIAVVLGAIADLLALQGKSKLHETTPAGSRADHRKRKGGRAMGEEPSTSGSAVSVEARNPEKIREEIEATRQELGDTIEALAEKTRAQAKHTMEESNAYVSKKKDDLLGKKDDLLGKKDDLLGKKDDLLANAKETSPESLVSDGGPSALLGTQDPADLDTAVIGKDAPR